MTEQEAESSAGMDPIMIAAPAANFPATTLCSYHLSCNLSTSRDWPYLL